MGDAVGVPAQKAVKGHGFGADIVAGQYPDVCQPGQCLHELQPHTVGAAGGAPDAHPGIGGVAAVGQYVTGHRYHPAVFKGQHKLQLVAVHIVVLKQVGQIHQRMTAAPMLIQKPDDRALVRREGVAQQNVRQAHSALPPVMGRVTPVIKPASSPSRKAMAGTTSLTRALRPMGLASAEA